MSNTEPAPSARKGRGRPRNTQVKQAHKSNVYEAVASGNLPRELFDPISKIHPPRKRSLSRGSRRPSKHKARRMDNDPDAREPGSTKQTPTDPVQHLPESDLLKAVHTYASTFYSRQFNRLTPIGIQEAEVSYQSMDETALIAMGILLEESCKKIIGKSGDWVFRDKAYVKGLEDDAGTDSGLSEEDAEVGEGEDSMSGSEDDDDTSESVRSDAENEDDYSDSDEHESSDERSEENDEESSPSDMSISRPRHSQDEPNVGQESSHTAENSPAVALEEGPTSEKTFGELMEESRRRNDGRPARRKHLPQKLGRDAKGSAKPSER